jgi:hypothetical protein
LLCFLPGTDLEIHYIWSNPRRSALKDVVFGEEVAKPKVCGRARPMAMSVGEMKLIFKYVLDVTTRQTQPIWNPPCGGNDGLSRVPALQQQQVIRDEA